MALQFGKHAAAQTLAALYDLGHRQLRIIVQDRLRHAAEITKRRDMAIAKCFRRLRWIRLDEGIIGLRQVHAEIMKPNLLTGDDGIRLAKIRLGVAGPVAQRHKHLARTQGRGGHILPHNRVAADIALLRPEPVEQPLGGVPLLGVNAAIGLKHRIDPGNMRPQLRRNRRLPPPIARRRRILQHLGNRVPMNPKPPRSLAVAQTIDHHGSPDSTIKFHSKHPSSQSMPVKGINRPSRTGTLLRRHKGRK